METPRKPRDDEIDVFGLTHVGRVRTENQDHFLIASIHKRTDLLQTSLSATERLPLGSERLAYLAMVADGVGGGVGGAEASATALETALSYVQSSAACYYHADGEDEDFIEELQHAALRCHEAIRAKRDPEAATATMATTLTLFMGVWPAYYLLQVGDSRYYLLRGGQLTQVTRDQTMAEDLVDSGVFTRSAASESRFAHILSSALGADTAAPVVTRLPAGWDCVHLLCSDGLTKHVSDARIAEILGTMTSAQQACERLRDEALAGGGTDNITVIVGRLVPSAEPV